MWVLAMVTTALEAQPDAASMSAQDSTALQVKRTTVWAACLPGSGQIRNRQIWKVPLVWGGMGYAAWATWDNAREMRASVDDLIALTDDDPTTQARAADEIARDLFQAPPKIIKKILRRQCLFFPCV